VKKTAVSDDELRAAGATASTRGFTRRFRQSFPVGLQGDAYLLGIAERAEAEGERLRRSGAPREVVASYLQRGADIRKGITADVEKPQDVQSAINGAAILQRCKELLDDIKSNTGSGPDFGNK
jgi:hypothetical protein